MKISPIEIKLDQRSRDLRKLIVQAIDGGRRGHIGSAFSLVEILRVLYDDVLRYDPKNPRWPQRDRCILSKGHGCLALYAVLEDKGFLPAAELKRFCKPDGILGGHPERHKVPGVEASTGSLGHGLPLAGQPPSGLQVAQGAATLAVSMAAASLTGAAPPAAAAQEPSA